MCGVQQGKNQNSYRHGHQKTYCNVEGLYDVWLLGNIRLQVIAKEFTRYFRLILMADTLSIEYLAVINIGQEQERYIYRSYRQLFSHVHIPYT